jgi:solute carrier family 50 (sugar transporter)
MVTTTTTITMTFKYSLTPACRWKTIAEIRRTQTTGQLSPLPFVSLLTNCLVWATYGVLGSDMTVLAPNISGILLGAYYTATFAKYSKESMLPKLAVTGAIAAATAVAAATLPAAEAMHYIGLGGCGLVVIMLASPLAVLKTVIKEKSTATLPFLTSFAGFCNSITWGGYGYLVAHDPMIWGPNLLGFASSVLQLSLFAIYPRRSKQ